MKKIFCFIVFCFISFVSNYSVATEIKIITDRSDVHLKTIIKNFEINNNIVVNINFVKDGIVEKAKLGLYDIMISKNGSEIIAAKKENLLQTLHPLILSLVPNQYKDIDNKWFMMSYRLRAFHLKKDIHDIPLSYEDLAKPQYKGRICIRNLTDNYNLELFATLLYDMGEIKFKQWFEDFKLNLARIPMGNDREQVKGVFDCKCDIAIANTYYRGLMLEDPEQKAWAESTFLYIPNQNKNDQGAIALYAGVGILSNKKENELFLLDLLGNVTQQYLSKNNYEYPIFIENISTTVQQYGVEQGLNYKTIKIHPNIQNELFDYKRQVYFLLK